MTSGPMTSASTDGIDLQSLVLNTFLNLRQSGFDLGIEEYKSGLSLVPDGSKRPFASDIDSLKQALKMIWCSSRSEQGQFEPLWTQALQKAEIKAPTKKPIEKNKSDQSEVRSPLKPPTPQSPPPTAASLPLKPQTQPSSPLVDTAIQPVHAPFTPAEIDHHSDLQHYWPVSRRTMSYSWRYLRRPVAEGPANIVDVAATIKQTAQQGFYLRPVMKRQRYNRAELVLLVDRNGSMMPLHQLTRQLVETALYESNLPEAQVTIGYFQNVPADYLYKDVFLTQPVAIDQALAGCDHNTSLIIVSDAGAARGHRRLERIRATVTAIQQLRQHTPLFAWLNPMPQDRWQGSSAEMIAKLVPMFQMDDDGLSRAIDVVRGLV